MRKSSVSIRLHTSFSSQELHFVKHRVVTYSEIVPMDEQYCATLLTLSVQLSASLSDVSGATWAAIQFMYPNSDIVLSTDNAISLGLYTSLTSELEDGDRFISPGS